MSSVKPAEVSAILREQLSGLKTEAEVAEVGTVLQVGDGICLLYTSPSPRDATLSRMPSSA